MKARMTAVAWALILVTASAAPEAAVWAIDMPHSSVNFKIRHLGISNVNGTFGEWDGELVFDENDLTAGAADITIRTASVNTDNQKRDDHLRSADFFEVEKFPTITFKSDKMERKGDGYVLTGKLKIMDVEKSVAIAVDYLGAAETPWGDKRAGFEGTLTIKREDFGVGWKDIKYHPPLIGNDVEITLNLEVVKQETE